ncbi:hypothetical protein QJS10_CPA10g01284 [Acorus calamus]|uniref:Uncharacterized protein n=1 Tax=Acorus calamus TaxID=4465 RepID=A0AAV9DWH9_ACOCL|nr:hypothetical protein QJS10_CPA10g01284 [Acorus calamus]
MRRTFEFHSNGKRTFEVQFEWTSNGSSSQKSAPDGHGDLNDPRVRLKHDCVGILAAWRHLSSTIRPTLLSLWQTPTFIGLPVPRVRKHFNSDATGLHAFIGGEPPFTNYTPGFVGTLDYIFFTPSSGLKPTSLIEEMENLLDVAETLVVEKELRVTQSLLELPV